MADEGEAQGEASEQQPSQEELLRQLEAALEQLTVADVLVQTVFTVSSLGYRRLGEEGRDLEQAKLAIDALRALVPALKGAVPAGLARELELCYATVAMVTDYDVGIEGRPAVTAADVVRVFEENNARLRELLFAVIPKIGPQPEDVCSTALRGATF